MQLRKGHGGVTALDRNRWSVKVIHRHGRSRFTAGEDTLHPRPRQCPSAIKFHSRQRNIESLFYTSRWGVMFTIDKAVR